VNKKPGIHHIPCERRDLISYSRSPITAGERDAPLLAMPMSEISPYPAGKIQTPGSDPGMRSGEVEL
jgi:hypothetical protein